MHGVITDLNACERPAWFLETTQPIDGEDELEYLSAVPLHQSKGRSSEPAIAALVLYHSVAHPFES